MMSTDYFTTPVSRLVWDSRYRYRDATTVHDTDIDATWQRVARAVAAADVQAQDSLAQDFYLLLRDFRFLPGGRIMAGAGTGRRVTLFNCFVMGRIEDSMEGIFTALREGALTMQQGGGVGYDFSTLRPAGSEASAVGGIASGPVSFMHIWDSMCSTLLSTGARRGAMMATLRCDHPDILAFIDAKQDAQALRHFNLSVLVSDAFMEAVRRDADWALLFPVSPRQGRVAAAGETRVVRDWPGEDAPVTCRVARVLRARDLWQRLMHASYDYAEPGVLFIDRINQWNNLGYREQISATNPCGEIPLPPYGACDLGSLNLTRFVERPFAGDARIDFDSLQEAAQQAVRFLDSVIDVSGFPLPLQQQQALQTRRIGLGITGLADALIMLGIRYGSQQSFQLADRVMQAICHAAYRGSVQLAREKGSFPAFDADRFLQGRFVQSLPDDIREAIATAGIRNSHLLAIAPTGTISLLANNVSSGLEPVFESRYRRRIRQPDGLLQDHEVVDYACQLWQSEHGQETLPPAFIDAHALSPRLHLQMQAVIQPYVDNAISKTINIPANFAMVDYQSVFEQAYRMGLKGCTAFRPNPVTGNVLSAEDGGRARPHCCDLDREAD
jgi:ribonucleoside-diphosphate reductase alpha chain